MPWVIAPEARGTDRQRAGVLPTRQILGATEIAVVVREQHRDRVRVEVGIVVDVGGGDVRPAIRIEVRDGDGIGAVAGAPEVLPAERSIAVVAQHTDRPDKIAAVMVIALVPDDEIRVTITVHVRDRHGLCIVPYAVAGRGSKRPVAEAEDLRRWIELGRDPAS